MFIYRKHPMKDLQHGLDNQRNNLWLWKEVLGETRTPSVMTEPPCGPFSRLHTSLPAEIQELSLSSFISLESWSSVSQSQELAGAWRSHSQITHTLIHGSRSLEGTALCHRDTFNQGIWCMPLMAEWPTMLGSRCHRHALSLIPQWEPQDELRGPGRQIHDPQWKIRKEHRKLIPTGGHSVL